MNSWKTKWHDSCKARYTVTFGDKVKEFVTLNEDKSKKDSKKRFKLISHEHEALKDPLNYQVICKTCSPTSTCPRHGHIAFCSDNGPKPNPKAKLTKNGPTRLCQRIFREKFKNEVYLHPKKDFLTSYNETKSKFLSDMNVDEELDNFVELQGISKESERYIFDHLFSAKCSNPLDIVQIQPALILLWND